MLKNSEIHHIFHRFSFNFSKENKPSLVNRKIGGISEKAHSNFGFWKIQISITFFSFFQLFSAFSAFTFLIDVLEIFICFSEFSDLKPYFAVFQRRFRIFWNIKITMSLLRNTPGLCERTGSPKPQVSLFFMQTTSKLKVNNNHHIYQLFATHAWPATITKSADFRFFFVYFRSNFMHFLIDFHLFWFILIDFRWFYYRIV